jgi:STE24 endopeptidase
MVGTQQSSTRLSGPHPSVTKRTPSRNDDFFDEHELRKLREYIAPLRRNRRIRLAISTVVDVVLVFVLDAGPKVAGWAEGQGWVVRLLLAAIVFDLISTAISVPFNAWATLVYEKRAGHSTTTVATFIKDLFVEFAIGMVMTVLLLIPIYAAIHAWGDLWWVAGAVLIVLLNIVMVFVAPIWIMPRFNKFTPLPEGPIRSRIEELAALQGVEIEGVYLMDASKRTTRANAGVTGFGKTKRVIVNDTICDFPMEELSQVIAHELGHYRRNHVPKSFPLLALQMPIALFLVQLLIGNDTVLGWAGVSDLGDPGSYPLLGLALAIPMSFSSLLSMRQSRTHEREADLEALELLGDPTSFVAVWPRMVLNDKANLEPTPWEKLKATHPEIAERMQFALDWASQNGVAVTKPAPRAVPETV